MHRRIAMMARVLATILGTVTILIGQHAGAATSPARGNFAATDPSGIDAVEYERAPVTLDGEVLFHVRGLPAYPAGERAKTIRKRIEAIAADQSVAAESLRAADMEDRTKIMAGDGLVVGFIDADAATEGVSRQLLAERALIKIKAQITAYRNDRSPRVLLINTLYALGATVLLLLGLFVIRRLFRKLEAVAERRFKSRIEALEAQSHQLVQAQQLSSALFAILRGLHLSALLALGYLYFHFVFFLYPWTRPLAARLFSILLDPRLSLWDPSAQRQTQLGGSYCSRRK